MKVKNDFPNVDKVLRNLKIFTEYFKGENESEDDKAMCLNVVKDFIKSIEKYLDSVCNGDTYIERMRCTTQDLIKVAEYSAELDEIRTSNHSSIISNMILIDRMADMFGLSRVFDYAEEFQKESSKLIVYSIDEKRKMTDRERIKRREMGNFGLYIAAAVTAGVSREASEIDDDDLREFANCDGHTVKSNRNIFEIVKRDSRKITKNTNDIIGIE